MRAILVAGAFLSACALTGTQGDNPPKAKPEAPAVQKLKETLKSLATQLRDEDPKVRQHAAETLGDLAEAVHGLGRELALRSAATRKPTLRCWP